MTPSIHFQNQITRSKKKKELVVFIFSALIIFSFLIYFTYLQKLSRIPPDFPTVHLYCSNNINGEDYIDCVLEFDYNIIDSNIKYRGGSAQNHEKKGYRIELSTQERFLGMRSDNDWQFFASYLDFTRMRIKLSFDLWRSLQPINPTAILPEAEYVGLYLNNEFQGLYLFSERPDRELFGFEKETSLNLNSSLIFQSKGETKFNEYIEDKWEQDWPNEEDINIINSILPELIYYINTANDEEFFDPNTGIYSLFDKVNLIDYYLFNFFIDHKDCWLKNYFIVRDNYPSKFYLVPWDFDGSFGQWGWIKYNSNENPDSEIKHDNYLWRRLLVNKKFLKECKDRWFFLREELWTKEFIMNMLLDDYDEIEPLIRIDTEMWKPINVKENPPQKGPYMYKYSTKEFDLDEYLDYLFYWIPERLSFCDQHFGEPN